VELAAVFLLPLLGGYYFFYFWRRTAFPFKRSQGHHLYFHAALGGVALFVAALTLRALLLSWKRFADFDEMLIEYFWPLLKGATPVDAAAVAIDQLRRVQWAITAGYSLVIGVAVTSVLNLFTSPIAVLSRILAPLDNLLLQAQLEDLPVSFTLSNGKTYIGLVAATPDPEKTPRAVSVLPMMSGKRDELGRMLLTTDYETLYTSLAEGRAAALELPADWINQFRLIIPSETIVSAALFSPAVYGEFNPHWRERLAEHKQGPPPQEVVVEIKQPEIPPWKRTRRH
jgi:hypothetical protein